tara:strand:- start:239 stop:790 length:552 start_codon:yes stop_codon:yes gene_type:complete
MNPTADQVLSLALQANLKLDPTFAIVVLRKMPGKVNTFDDLLCILWRDGDRWEIRGWACTADPGLYWLKNPGRIAGTAILIPGQHPFVLGEHKGQYPCLAQAAPLATWRDNDRDDALRYGGQIYRDSEGIQIHHAGTASAVVDRWSAGCIVVANMADWQKFWKFILAAKRSQFMVTLLEWPNV